MSVVQVSIVLHHNNAEEPSTAARGRHCEKVGDTMDAKQKKIDVFSPFTHR